MNIVDQTTGQVRDAYSILNDISNIWDSLDKNTQSALATASAGTHQKNTFLSIIENWENVKKSVESASDAIGSADEENSKYLDSIEGKTASFKSAFQELSSDIVDSDSIKGIIDFGTKGIKVFDEITKHVNLFQVALTALAIVINKKLGYNGVI